MPLQALRAALAAALATAAAGCAVVPDATATSDASNRAASAANPASTPPAGPVAVPPATRPQGTPPDFATVIKDAKKVEGLFTVWQRDDRVWFELKPSDFGKPFFLSPKLASGLGESLHAGSMRQAQLVEFRRIHNQVQLRAVNTEYFAREGTPERRAVDAAFSPSLLSSSVVASQAHAQTQHVLVEANPLFLNDLLGIAAQLNRTYRQGYAFDGRHSSIVAVRGKPRMMAIEVQNHYYTGSLSTPQPGGMPGTQPSVPRTVPDPRSLFVNLHFSLSALPEQPMVPRRADPRVGHFNTTVENYSDELARTPKQRFVDRWRLDKKDPAAALSEPVKPLTYWLDRNIPVEYRDAVRDGILEWNKAFERIGIKDAIVVRQQPDDADFDTLDADVASVRWLFSDRPSFGAIGPRHVDPRTGEILDADILLDAASSRFYRSLRSSGIVPVAQAHDDVAGDPRACSHADHLADQMGYALDLLAARDELEPGSPLTQAFVREYVKGVTMHEVGHTLGLRHNFRASRAYTPAQLADPAFTAANGITGSVMEYPALNLPPPGVPMARHGQVFRGALGPYDYWAIEYAYKPFAPDHEAAELARIAARSSEPQLAYGTDEDSFLGIDPDALTFDLGDDLAGFVRSRIAIAQDLIRRQETRTLRPDEDYATLRRSVRYALIDVGNSTTGLAKQIGGLRTLRDFPGSGRDPLQPVPAAAQREALDVLARGVFSPDAFAVSPALARRLAPDFHERSDALYAGQRNVGTDFTLDAGVGELQRSLLTRLLDDSVAARILDSVGKAARPADAFRLSELYGRLSREIWSEAWTPGRDVPPLRRELQRDHVNRVANILLRPGSLARADARGLMRADAQALLVRIEAARRTKAGLSEEARAHLDDAADTLSQALTARLSRFGT
jgi:hypothetical protein